MIARVIILGDEHRIRAGRYAAAWRACLALPPHARIGPGVSGWGETAGEALAQLRQGLHARINRHLPWYGRGRKWDDDWQRAMIYAAVQLNTPRLRIHWLPPALTKRFTHRLARRSGG